MSRNHPFTVGITTLFEKHRNVGRAIPMKAYMRDQFEFIGIQATERRALTRQYFKSRGLPEKSELDTIIRELWALPEREFQYVGIELAMKYRKQWHEKDMQLFEYMVLHKSWWDTVDTISNKLIGPWLQLYPGQIKSKTGKWNHDKNIWLQRLSLIFQLTYKSGTDTALLERHILHLKDSKEFFVQKAIGWSLRQYARYNPNWVMAFVKKHPLPPLSKREALKGTERSKS